MTRIPTILPVALFLAVLPQASAQAEAFYFRSLNPMPGLAGAPEAPTPGQNAPATSPPVVASALAIPVQDVSSGSACAGVGVSNPSDGRQAALSFTLDDPSGRFGTCSTGASACGTTLSPGASCEYGLRLASATNGTFSATLRVRAGTTNREVSVTGEAKVAPQASGILPVVYNEDRSPTIVKRMYNGHTDPSYFFMGYPSGTTIVFSEPVTADTLCLDMRGYGVTSGATTMALNVGTGAVFASTVVKRFSFDPGPRVLRFPATTTKTFVIENGQWGNYTFLRLALGYGGTCPTVP